MTRINHIDEDFVDHHEVVKYGCLNGEYRFAGNISQVIVDKVTCQENNMATALDETFTCVKGNFNCWLFDIHTWGLRVSRAV